MSEPFATALLLTSFGLLLAVSVIFSRASERVGVPVVLVFLVIGILAGSEGIGRIAFDDFPFAFRVGTVALVFILFDGGFNTSMAAIRQSIRPAGVLATLGVVLTAALLAAAARLVGFSWPEAMVVGAIVSSTDAAAVFSVLRGSGLHLQRRLGTTLEVESGINDPMAVILTVVLTENLANPGGLDVWRIPLDVLIQLVVGGAVGAAWGYGGRRLLRNLRLPASGLYPALTVGIASLAFGTATLLNGSGILAVFVAGVLLGDGQIPYRAGLVRVHDALAWLGQITMFLLLGLLVFPSQLLAVAGAGLWLAFFLSVVARPVAVAICLAPFNFRFREVAYIGWVGLRGAVPIILGTFPVLAGAPGADRIFNAVFFVVVLSAIVPGGTVAWLTRRLGFERRHDPDPAAVLAIESRQELQGELRSFYIRDTLAVAGLPLSEIPLPEGAAIVLLVRGNDLVAPKPETTFMAGDHVYVVCRPEDRAMVQLLFGRPESD